MATENVNENTFDAKGKKIHFTISIDDDSQSTPVAQPKKKIFSDETSILEKLNLVYKTGERNTEHGITSITVVDFQDDEQHKRALRLFTNHFSRTVWRVIPLLHEFGLHTRTDVRYRAAHAVGELMCEMDFIRIKNEIIIPWATHYRLDVNANVGLAFSVVVKHEKYAENVKKLLKHWSSVSNADLNRSALAGIIPLCTTWPDESLEIVRFSLGRDSAFPWDYSMLVTLSAYILEELCNKGHTEKVFEKLKEWIVDSDKASIAFRRGASLTFITMMELSHLLEYQAGRDKVISMCIVCIEERLDNMGSIHDYVLEKLKEWAEEAFGNEEKEEFVAIFFSRLYRRFSTDRWRDILAHQVKRWQLEDTEKRFSFILNRLAH